MNQDEDLDQACSCVAHCHLIGVAIGLVDGSAGVASGLTNCVVGGFGRGYQGSTSGAVIERSVRVSKSHKYSINA